MKTVTYEDLQPGDMVEWWWSVSDWGNVAILLGVTRVGERKTDTALTWLISARDSSIRIVQRRTQFGTPVPIILTGDR